MGWFSLHRGARAERLAARHLRRQGCRILATNLRIGRAEIDLVAADGPALVLVEVKARHAADPAAAAAAVDHRKMARLLAALPAVRRRTAMPSGPARLDIVAVLWGRGRRPEVLHYRNVADIPGA